MKQTEIIIEYKIKEKNSKKNISFKSRNYEKKKIKTVY